MKHSEMLALVSLIFFARAAPKGICILVALATSLFSIYLSAHSN
jgi:hypothetical protein